MILELDDRQTAFQEEIARQRQAAAEAATALDEEAATLGAQLAEQFDDLLAGLRIQVAGRLIRED